MTVRLSGVSPDTLLHDMHMGEIKDGVAGMVGGGGAGGDDLSVVTDLTNGNLTFLIQP